jgi:hypothetical protein
LHELSRIDPNDKTLKGRLILIDHFIGPRNNYVNQSHQSKIHVLGSGQIFAKPDSRNSHQEIERILHEQRAHAAIHGRALFGYMYDWLMYANEPQSPHIGE